MKISLIKSKNDNENFRMFKAFGFNVVEIKDLDKTDIQIKKLIDENYRTIILTNEVAAFSGDIITKYKNSPNINIIIAPCKGIEN